ncbi:hypothetical protein EVAR_39595_1 [Eumeta japonica]|uniref:Uncharacterized protein n=1 Tax=Eumeta variegata TaxID=151549 RepID=A0A4C1Y5A4_EUMVA|nr:hypothetical protein EVAR_39595_1 [Eumeta japonica]
MKETVVQQFQHTVLVFYYYDENRNVYNSSGKENIFVKKITAQTTIQTRENKVPNVITAQVNKAVETLEFLFKKIAGASSFQENDEAPGSDGITNEFLSKIIINQRTTLTIILL